jgi:1,4-alpha-glucan branching enzyme
MGSEFAQNDEWSESAGLQWHLTEYAEHQGVQRVIADLNSTYKQTAALWEKDNNPEGFSWLVNNDGAANVVAFSRWDDHATPLVSVTNFSPVPHENYQLPFPSSGTWSEVLNTDDSAYGGSGVHNEQVVVGPSQIASVKIPPLATVWFKCS